MSLIVDLRKPGDLSYTSLTVSVANIVFSRLYASCLIIINSCLCGNNIFRKVDFHGPWTKSIGPEGYQADGIL